MKLHTFVGSPNGRKVEAVIRHLGLAVETVHWNFLAGDLASPGFRALNSNGKVPVLVDGPFVLWESNAIMQYLADKVGDDALFPRDPWRRASVVRWLFWEAVHFNKAFGTIAFETVAKPKLGIGPTDQPLVDAALVDLARFAPVLEQHLADCRTLVGETVTLADYAMVKLEAYRDPVPFDWSPYRQVNGYFDRMRQLAPWAETEPGFAPVREPVEA
ncbi:MAG TPA: glutathione S-transferase family protein [Aliidongia sp.]|uniref:glutathione S-transferase family protein n=1 Tax=Aliidongia sp. TaxID=1914230 RepID=UPI002DDD08B7|nr:glutathione S-transferase family protein [Aliidongia sp.]HEV2677969.1 glutathione S-transferase family protein [Aliidongia sp.]